MCKSRQSTDGTVVWTKSRFLDSVGVGWALNRSRIVLVNFGRSSVDRPALNHGMCSN